MKKEVTVTSTTSSPLWWRHQWMNAVWASDLKPLERLVAAVYAEHARDRRQTFVTRQRLMAFTGLSPDAANRAIAGLVAKGWLTPVGEPRPRRPIDYQLTIPPGASTSPVSGTSTGDVPTSSADVLVASTSPDATSTSPDATSTGDVLHQRSYLSSQDKSSSSTPRAHAASLLGWDEEDDRLDLLDDFLRESGARSAKPWLTRVHANGDLERNLTAFVDAKRKPDLWAQDEEAQRIDDDRIGLAETHGRLVHEGETCNTCGAGPAIGHRVTCELFWPCPICWKPEVSDGHGTRCNPPMGWRLSLPHELASLGSHMKQLRLNHPDKADHWLDEASRAMGQPVDSVRVVRLALVMAGAEGAVWPDPNHPRPRPESWQ